MKTTTVLSSIAALAFALASPALAAEYRLELKSENATIHWTLGDVLHTVSGTFILKRGTIDFNPETGTASGLVVVDVASGQSGSDARDSRMHANVLESKKYPEATFVPDRTEGTLTIPGTSTLKIHGKFNIHGAPHDVTLDVQATTTQDRINTTIRFDLPYVAWGMKDPSNFLLKVEKTVKMSIETSGSLQRR